MNKKDILYKYRSHKIIIPLHVELEIALYYKLKQFNCIALIKISL